VPEFEGIAGGFAGRNFLDAVIQEGCAVSVGGTSSRGWS